MSIQTISTTGWIQTHSGRYIDLLNPKPEDIDIKDIAHHLSLICRFNGACKEFYSVAEHCFFSTGQIMDPRLRPAALLHDAAEAYVGDLISPIKNLLPEFKKIEERIQSVIYERFNIRLSDADRQEMKKVDMVMLATERRDLMPRDGQVWEATKEIKVLPFHLEKLDSKLAKRTYLRRAEQLGIE